MAPGESPALDDPRFAGRPRTGRWTWLWLLASGVTVIWFGWGDGPGRSGRPGSRGRLTVDPRRLQLAAEATTSNPEKVTIRLSNSGDEPLAILRIEKSCACTELLPLPRQTLAPGESTELSAKFRMPAPGASTSARIEILTDSSADNPLETVYVDLVGPKAPLPRVFRQPQLVELASHEPSASAAGEFKVVTLEHASDPPLIAGFEADDDDVRVEPTRDVEDGSTGRDGERLRTYEFRVTAATPDSPLEVRRFMLTPLAAAERQPLASPIRVEVRYLPVIRVVPPQLAVRDVSAAAPRTIKALVLGPLESSWSITSIDSDADWASCEFQDDSPDDGKALLNVSVQPAANDSREPRHATVTIHTTLPEMPTVTLPIEVRPPQGS